MPGAPSIRTIATELSDVVTFAGNATSTENYMCSHELTSRASVKLAARALALLVVRIRPHRLAIQLPDTVSREQVRVDGTDESIISWLTDARDHAAERLVGGALRYLPDGACRAESPPLDLKVHLFPQRIET